MNFATIAAGTKIFVDANSLIYHFTSHAKYGVACTELLERIEQQVLTGYISSHVLADVSHRLMTIEAMSRMNWPTTALAARLKKHHTEIRNLTLFHRRSVESDRLVYKSFPLPSHSWLPELQLASNSNCSPETR